MARKGPASGPGERGHPRGGRFWHGDFNPYGDDRDAQGEDPYYGALGYGDPTGTERGTPASVNRGPKGYQRSDERILEDLCERLARSDWLDVRDVTVDVKEGRVTLGGTVPVRQMRYAIEDIAADCRGALEVINDIRVSIP